MAQQPAAARALVTPTLSRDAVTLRALTRADVEALARASAEGRESYRFNVVPEGLAAADAYVDKALSQRATGFRMPFVILWHGRVVGTSSYSELLPWEWHDPTPLRRTDRPDAVEVGYSWLAASAQRTEVNTTAKYLLFAHAFEVWEVHSITLRTDQRNELSRRAIARLGASFEGIRRAHCAGRDGTVRSSAFFSIVREEWPTVRTHVHSLLSARDSDAVASVEPR